MVEELDWKILNELRKDSRVSYRKLAEKLGVATGTVQARISKMEQEGIILGYEARLNYDKLGFSITSLIGITLRARVAKKILEQLAKHPNVFAAYAVTGEFDVIAGVKFKTMQDLNDFITNELSDSIVERTVTFLILSNAKEHHTLVQ